MRTLTSGAGALLAVAAVLVGLAMLGGRTLPSRTGAPIEELTVERTVLEPETITLTMRNGRPDPVRIAQVAVNDSYVDFTGGDRPIGRLGTGTVRLSYPWQPGQPYQVSMLTSTGAVIEYDIPAAAATPPASGHLLGLMALLGTYVGIIPVLLGLLFLPMLRRISRRVLQALLGLTVGLLGFLAVDALLEGLDLAGRAGGAFGGTLLVPLGAGLTFLLLSTVDRGRRSEVPSSPARLATMIAIGIGLHNLGEGLTIGSAYAVGELALGTGLVVGFAVHNTTEGLAIVAPLTAEPRPWPRLLALGIVAGAPAILGALIGATADNASLAALLLGAGTGAIAAVIVQIWPSLREKPGAPLSPPVLGGLAGGVLTMYLTGLLVA
jgi:zinc transporter, ZIP family